MIDSVCLFIDDMRDPPDNGRNWKVIRSFNEFVDFYSEPGYCKDDHIFHSYMSFDHDLGLDMKTGHDIVKWMIDQDMLGLHLFPADFHWTCHSENPVGKANIDGLLESYINFKLEYGRK